MELLSNLVQLAATVLGFCLAGARYRRERGQVWFLLTCFYGCFALGALYWTLYLLLFDTTPQVFYVSEFGWISSAVFLLILQYTLASEGERAFRCGAVWLAPAVGVPLCVLYCTYGDILSNLLWCGMMVVLSWGAIRGLVYADGGRRRWFHIGVLAFAAAEYLLWTAGCFWQSDSLASPVFWCDVLLTAAILSLLGATEKAVEA